LIRIDEVETPEPTASHFEIRHVDYRIPSFWVDLAVTNNAVHDTVLLSEDSAEKKDKQERVQKVFVEKEWGMSLQAGSKLRESS
jgi:hypothetical protein